MGAVRRAGRRGAAASERTGVVALRGGGVESGGMRAGEAERRRCRETERRRLGRKKIFLKIILTFRKFGLSLCALKMIRALK